LVSQFYHFPTIFYNYFGSGDKRKRKTDEQHWAESNPGGPARAEKRPRARPRWQTCTEALGVLTNCERALSLFNTVTDTLLKSPPTSNSLHAHVHDDGSAGSTPARFWTDRLGLWLGSPSGGHEIGVTMIISLDLIALIINYGALATVAVSMAAIRSCSRRPEDS
jgi:hypothetical protein